MNSSSSLRNAIIIVLIVLLIICLCCSFLSSYFSGYLNNFKIKAIPPLNQYDTQILMISIEPIIKNNLEQAQNMLNDIEKKDLANSINSNINPISIPMYVKIKNYILPKIYDQINLDLTIIPSGIRNKLNNKVPKYMISDIIDYQFTTGIQFIRTFEKGVGIWKPTPEQ